VRWQVVENPPAQVGEPGPLDDHQVVTNTLEGHRTGPEAQGCPIRLTPPRPVALRGARPGLRATEQHLVDVGADRVGYEVAAVLTVDQLCTELAPETCDDGVDRSDVERGCLLGPDEVEEDVCGNGATPAEQEGREDVAGSASGGKL
jgi:hypothetical protein